jgi:predicted nucleic acid-binding protein
VIVLDTNVFVYAAGVAHPLRSAAVGLLQAARTRDLDITTTPEVIQEFLQVHSTRRSRVDTAERGAELLAMSSPLVVAGEDDASLAIELFREHDGLDAFDCLLAAVAIREGADLVSADRAFGEIRELPWYDLAGLDVGRFS